MTVLMFDGETFDPALDGPRLTKQIARIFNLMADGRWRTLQEISEITGAPTPSVSTRLRDFRKDRFGGFTVEKRRRTADGGTYEYRLIVEHREAA
jgi:hypothetical protein